MALSGCNRMIGATRCGLGLDDVEVVVACYWSLVGETLDEWQGHAQPLSTTT